jgi:hypothetical protein
MGFARPYFAAAAAHGTRERRRAIKRRPYLTRDGLMACLCRQMTNRQLGS